MSPYLMFGAIAVIGAVIVGRPRPSGTSGRSVADKISTIEGQQNRNRGARRMKATRNLGLVSRGRGPVAFHPPLVGAPRKLGPHHDAPPSDGSCGDYICPDPWP